MGQMRGRHAAGTQTEQDVPREAMAGGRELEGPRPPRKPILKAPELELSLEISVLNGARASIDRGEERGPTEQKADFDEPRVARIDARHFGDEPSAEIEHLTGVHRTGRASILGRRARVACAERDGGPLRVVSAAPEQTQLERFADHG